MKEFDIKILVATHKKYQMPVDDIYLPIHVGREGKCDLGYQGDNTGEHISHKNPYYCELTGLYWAWKNFKTDYLGLCHYRRYFSSRNSFQIKSRKNLKGILGKHEIEEILKDFDIIVPKRRNYLIETVWSHYQNAHNIKDLEETKLIIKEKYPEYLLSFNSVMSNKKLHLFNMFIMKKVDFDSYCEWLFDILFELENRIDLCSYDSYQKRVFGFLSERLFNVWIHHNRIKTKELPVINIEKINWGKKIFNFLKRKVNGV